jgi:hypothetical protein
MLPYLDRPVLRTGRDARAVRTPIQRVHLVLVSRQRFPRSLAARYLPQLRGRILARSHEVPTVAAPRHLIHRTDVTRQGRYEVSRPTVPYLNLTIERCRCEEARVGGECDVIDRLLMSGESLHRTLVHRRMPKEQREVVATGYQPLRLVRGLEGIVPRYRRSVCRLPPFFRGLIRPLTPPDNERMIILDVANRDLAAMIR